MKKIIINGEETKYYITKEGKIWSSYKNMFLKTQISEHGYENVHLSINKKKISKYVHRLMAETYLGFKGEENKVINHKDGNKLNNNLSNLEIITSSENLYHAYKNNLKKPSNKKTTPFCRNLENEIWKNILGFDGKYEVSNFGRVKSNCYNSPILLRPDLRCGYESVTLSLRGKTKHYLIHHLVWETFNEKKREKDFVIDHIDGNKKNNHLDNLRCISKSENVNFALYEQKTNKNCKAVVAYKGKEKVGEFSSIAAASRELQVDASSISKCCKGKAKTVKGFTFSYL